MKSALYHKTALVTGGAKRIGRELCLSLARQGVHVVIHYHTSALEAKKLSAEIKKLGVNCWTVAADLGNAENAATLVKKALQRAGKLDIVINNASVFTAGTIDEVDVRDFTRNMRINAWAPFVIGREFKKLAVKGQLINLLDTRIRGGDLRHIGYIASKHALAALTGMMALEFAPEMTVNAVAPGLILPPAGTDAATLQKLAAGLPLKRHGSPSDVAQAVLFLLQSSFITGQVIYVDGGRTMRELMK
jgi:pteridine reductase